MKLGLSSYSLLGALNSKEMSIIDAVQWVADQGGEHVEIVPNLGFNFEEDPMLIDKVREKAAEVGIDISNYAIGANFITDSDEDFQAEIERVKKEVDIANRLGVKFMRHDVASRPIPETTIQQFQADLPKLTVACREIADYANQYGIITSVENHGYYIQASDRVQTLVNHVDRPNFKSTLDIGNFLCVDEDPVVATKNNIAYASVVHFKDFFHRPAHLNPGEGWMQTASGNYLRGTIVGHGDIDIREVIKVVKAAGFDGYISVEFEGMEECKQASKIGMANVRRLWDEV
ncbi:sugar phosphate isomerase/epimerase family protein [Sporosarcina sp. G11-34]|uniref:sugar phosphate isomerase/epimerase family protein n=1 Tax=Sporosarcina sp. G11-34 TaxID=2849605 RepID=UPI0022A96BB1|nr:sugar phosphate isomerase/epimerase family protein [Sporosarcina sp. G11-34]MCZ2258490.1 sugar phosphate isomerase/epimerase [Sporosarcina sp. G11-34]